ncbi:chemotaxis protein CheA [Sulfitobacter sp. SK011]|uniref:chemotaxis protein CheA n=1 Tax=Sulfitobacter sp. SK011 TaxID=1389004 RepID=UPI000E0A3C87|nr:chemotaxis protein CheA [Sulfitobacter sp. SK011]AXI42499.1 chemotaxis protein CheA [Sulfitobacter sp. SK011]
MNSQIDPLAEIRASFFIECDELIEALQDGLRTIEEGQSDSETINVVFRAVHSVKGGAGAFGLDALVRFAHSFETVLVEVRSGHLQIDPSTLKLFYQAADHLSDLVLASRDSTSFPDAETATLVAKLDDLLGDDVTAEPLNGDAIDFQPMPLSLDLSLGDDDTGDPDSLGTSDAMPKSPDRHCYVVTFTPFPELFETGNEPFVLLRNLSSLGSAIVTADLSKIPDLQFLVPELPTITWTIWLETNADASEITSVFEFVEGQCSLQIELGSDQNSDNTDAETTQNSTALSPGTAEKPNNGRPSNIPAPSERSGPITAPPKSMVRVDLDRIERLVNLVGELVINQAMLSQSLEQSGLPPYSDAMSGLEEFQRLTRDIQDSVMMIRAQPVKSLFQRMSRITRETSGALAKDVRLYTQGEDTEVDKTVIERLAHPLTHMIRNAVDHGLETTQARIAAGKPPQGEIRLSAAHRSGRVIIEIADDGAGINRSKVLQIATDKGLVPADSQLSETEIDNLLFLPGFSTSSVVSELSGRGVGMDVVRTAIQALGGRITIQSVPGTGTTFSISLPLTLAVLEGMVVEVAGETLVLPLNLVIETLTVTENDVEMVRPGTTVVRVRGTLVPLFDLGLELGYRPPLPSFDEAVILLVAHEDGNRAALIIDNILDQRQVVIKGLDESFYRAPGVAAATILGDGQIALILDPSDIISNAGQHSAPRPPILDAGALA